MLTIDTQLSILAYYEVRGFASGWDSKNATTPFCFHTDNYGAKMHKSKTNRKTSKSKNTIKKILMSAKYTSLKLLDYNSARFHDQIF